jgi:hypothetical protein
MNLPLETWYLSAAYEPIIRRVAIVLSFAGKGCGWGWMLCCIRLELLQESLYLWIKFIQHWTTLFLSGYCLT